MTINSDLRTTKIECGVFCCTLSYRASNFLINHRRRNLYYSRTRRRSVYPPDAWRLRVTSGARPSVTRLWMITFLLSIFKLFVYYYNISLWSYKIYKDSRVQSIWRNGIQGSYDGPRRFKCLTKESRRLWLLNKPCLSRIHHSDFHQYFTRPVGSYWE